MPVKVRCRQCEKVFAAPDRARGKRIRCPECREPVKVPSGKRKVEAETESADDDSFFSSLDLSQAEDATARLCPKCAAEVSTEARTCPHCHVDLQTGTVSSRMQKRLKRKGPDPALFYKTAWADSWRFMLSNQRLVFQTWIVNIFIVTMQVLMVFVAFWIVITFLPPLPDDAQKMAMGDNAEEEEKFKVPLLSELLLKNGFNIMSAMSAFIYMIITGWFWTMAVQIVRTTMSRKSQAKRLSFQVVDSLANGFKMYFWGVIFPLPVLVVAVPAIILMAGGSTVLSGGALPQPQAFQTVPIMIVGGAIGLVIALSIPSALAHMAQKHTYRAWSLPLMAITSVRNIVPTLYLGLMGLIAAILPVAVIGGGVAINFYVLKVAFNTPHFLAWTPLSTFEGATEGAAVNISFPWEAVGGYAGTIIVASLFGAYALIFWTRAVGLYTYYFQQRLGLIKGTKPGELAGFWARYVAVLVDTVIVAVVGCVFEPVELWKMNEKGKLVAVLFGGLAVSLITQHGFGRGLALSYLALLPICGISYFARSECSKEQATLGKEAVGIMVSGLNGERLTFSQSLRRAIMKILLGVLSFVAGFTPRKQAPHDVVAKTLVVFRGDLDRE